MFFFLLGIFVLVLVLPFTVKRIEHHLELFLFAMGLLATVAAGVFSTDLIREVLSNVLLYMITAAVLFAGILFKVLNGLIRRVIDAAIVFVPFRLLIFLIIVFLGLCASVITAIIASLLLVEIITMLPLPKRARVRLCILACFSIGLGAALTPIGEPLSTIVVSKLDQDFWFLFHEIAVYILPGILGLGLIGLLLVRGGKTDPRPETPVIEMANAGQSETYAGVLIRALKIFLFITALELLGAGFRPVIDAYMIKWDSRLLYWVNMTSAILDNATLAAAEISAKLTAEQIRAILMGLLISGGMLIPGNIPNIIAAGRLGIGSREWARLGVPLGLGMMAVFYVLVLG